MIERSAVVLATRGREFRPDLNFVYIDNFVGDPETGSGPQCDAQEFCQTVFEEFGMWEKDRKRSCFGGEALEVQRRVEARPILKEYVWGALERTRNRCANCPASSDTLNQRPFIDLNMKDGIATLQGLYVELVKEERSPETRCPISCGGLAYQQRFLEKESPILIFRLLRFRHRADYSEEKVLTDVTLPERIDFLRSGPYQLAAVVMHHGAFTNVGHYTTLCWEGARDGEARYRWYSDDAISSAMTWAQVRRRTYYDGSSVGSGAYMLFYVRTGFWSDSVGDGSERVPYLRDVQSEEVARCFFRGQPVVVDLE